MLNELFERKTDKSIHIIFLLLISLNYLVPILIFGNITLFYHDALDSEIVYNHVIGNHYAGNGEALRLFINGEINLNFLRRIYQPIIIFYYLFDIELAYWLTDVCVKLVSYFCFYHFAKKINENYLVCGLSACLFASINIPTHNGLGVAVFPYIILLCIGNEKISIKNLIILVFFGLNSDLVFTIFSLPFLFIVLILLSKKEDKFYDFNNIKVFFIFFISILISNLNLILLSLSDINLHREEFFKEPDTYANFFVYFLSHILHLVNEINFSFFLNLPYLFLISSILLMIFFSKQKKAVYIFFLVLLIKVILIFLKGEIYLNFYNEASGLARTLNLRYCSTILPFLYSIIVLFLFKNKKIFYNNVLKVLIFISIILSQTNSSIVPFYKKFILKEDNYRNIYTFDGYYLFEDYKKLKKIVKNDRTISVGIDPMIAVVNNIGTIDGYHNVYPLSYKIKFRKVIEREIEKNIDIKKYYDYWGSRIYAFTSNSNEILINFKEAKKLGAKYVISKYDLNFYGLKLLCDDCSKHVKLYLIE